MNKKATLVFCGIVSLLIALFLSSPLEILNATANRITTAITEIIIAFVFIKICMTSIKIESKALKILSLILIGIVALPYLYIGIFTTLLVTSNHYPMWEDITVYSNKEGEKVIDEFIELSGSIYDYRKRKVIKELGNEMRLSTDYSQKNMKGVWTVYDIKRDSSYTIDFTKIPPH